ncbi:Uncharacterised protein at_DN2339 [Pycnogonum litorale]
MRQPEECLQFLRDLIFGSRRPSLSSPHRIFNIDETDITTVQTKPTRIGTNRTLNSAERGILTTAGRSCAHDSDSENGDSIECLFWGHPSKQFNVAKRRRHDVICYRSDVACTLQSDVM